jgi:ribosomal protein S27AE
MVRIYDIERAKVENEVCPNCGNKLLSGGWNAPVLADSTLELFCEKCNLKFVIRDGIFGSSVDKYKI